MTVTIEDLVVTIFVAGFIIGSIVLVRLAEKNKNLPKK
jgi:hypothetical protein